MHKQLQKRYWVFHSPAHEESCGLRDFSDSFQTLDAAKRHALASPEWGAIVDSHTGKEYSFGYNQESLKPSGKIKWEQMLK